MRKPAELTNYRDYIQSAYWIERKRLYYLGHPHKCAVCGHPDVELHHLKYGSYGHERDKDLAALCRVHHEELHHAIALRKNMFYQSIAVIEDMKAQWEEFRNGPVQKTPIPKTGSSFVDLIERLARPIWPVLGKR